MVDVAGDVAQKGNDRLKLGFYIGRDKIVLFGVGQCERLKAGCRFHVQTRRAGFDGRIFSFGQGAVDAFDGGAVVETGIHFAPHALSEFRELSDGHREGNS